MADHLGVEKLRLYATGSNLITITGYSGLDPDFKGANSVWNSGTDTLHILILVLLCLAWI